MWIALAIIGGLAVVITAILKLPLYIIIKNDEKNELILLYRFLGKIHGENPDPNDPIVRTLKRTSGVDRFEKEKLQKKVQTSGLKESVKESLAVLGDILKEAVALLKFCTATKWHIRVRCAGEDPADAAMHYGYYSAAIYGVMELAATRVKFLRRRCKVEIDCAFNGEEEIFRYDVELRVTLDHVIAAFWRLAWAEAKRNDPNLQQPAQKRPVPQKKKKPQQK